MKKMRNKSKIAIALFLSLSFAVSLFAVLPTAKGVIAVPDRPTGAYISVNPPLIGINQPLTVNAWVYPQASGPQYELGYSYPMIFHNLTVTFTRPDGSKDTFMPLHGSWKGLGLKPGETDESGCTWFFYKANQLGTWSVSLSFPGETYYALNWSVYYKPSTSRTISFEVQEDNVQIGFPPVQLPTGYWERPISAENREWSQVSGSMLSPVGSEPWTYFNPYSAAPNSAHILWTNEVSFGGLIGGEYGGQSGPAGGGSPGIICNGRVYYNQPTATGTQMRCVDLRTGEVIWQTPGSISAGQISSVEYTVGLGTGIYTATPAPYLWE